MEHAYIKILLAYPRDLDTLLTPLLEGSGMTGSQLLDPDLVDEFLAQAKDWELYDQKDLRAGLEEARKDYQLDDQMALQAVYFPDSDQGKADADHLLRRLYEQFGGQVQVLGEQSISNAHWDEEWKKHYQPLNIGQTIRVVPAWMDEEVGDRVKILIEPGMAFGTGFHETTQLCLKAMEKMDLEGKDGLDLGCGSGILAIYMKLAGCKRVEACDIDKDALLSSKKNFELNQVDVKAYPSDLFDQVEGRFDLVTANLLAPILDGVLAGAPSYLKPGGRVLLSGILLDQEEEVKNRLEAHGFKDLTSGHQGEWCIIGASPREGEKDG